MTERLLDVAIPDGIDFKLEDTSGNAVNAATFVAGDAVIIKGGITVVDATNLPVYITGTDGKYRLDLSAVLDFRDPPTSGPFVARLTVEINHSTGPVFRNQSIAIRLGGANTTSYRETP